MAAASATRRNKNYVLATNCNSNVKLYVDFDSGQLVGSGRFGNVLKARISKVKPEDRRLTFPQTLAVKLIRAKDGCKRGKMSREASILSGLQHQTIVRLFFISFDNSSWDRRHQTCSSISMYLEYLPLSLYSILRENGSLSVEETLLLTRQMISGLRYLDTMQICHRDIKPANLLLNDSHETIKICDFGCAKTLKTDETRLSYMCSRYYRPPELILGSTTYGCEVDWWSAACVIAEMLTARCLFCGDTSIDQLVEIVEVLGPPSQSEMEEMALRDDSNIMRIMPSIRTFKTIDDRLKSRLPNNIPSELFTVIKYGLSYATENRFQMLLQ